MISQMKVLAWLLLALAACVLLLGVVIWEHKYARARWSTFLVGNPHTGSHLFREKGCAHCHAVNGSGGTLAPDLGYEQRPQGDLNELVTAMWNHAPRMWETMRVQKLPYPSLSYEEMAHLFAYLYTARYVDEPGDAQQGQRLFQSKGCVRCHALYGEGGKIGPDLSGIGGADTPVVWTQLMWNHAPAMEAEMRRVGLDWPKFQGQEMNDLLAYIREVTGGPRRESQLLPASPERGWKLFQSKSCIVCHTVKGEGGRTGPELAPGRESSPTIIQFAGLMWNHSPQMFREMQAQGIPRPTFSGREMADLIAFLDSARYFEPGGSSQMGQMLFVRRGCSHCHGDNGEGTPAGPALRGRGVNFTSVTLAAELWRHGPQMEQRARKLGYSWPKLAQSDIGDLLVFLNTPPTPTQARAQPAPLPGKR